MPLISILRVCDLSTVELSPTQQRATRKRVCFAVALLVCASIAAKAQDATQVFASYGTNGLVFDPVNAQRIDFMSNVSDTRHPGTVVNEGQVTFTVYTPSGSKLKFTDGGNALEVPVFQGISLVPATEYIPAGTPAGNYTLQADYLDPQGKFGASSSSIGVVIGQAPQTINFPNPGNQVFGVGPFVISATGGGSGNPVTFAPSHPAYAQWNWAF